MDDKPLRRYALAELPPWMGGAALGFVLLTLVALVTVPLLVQRRVDALRSRIEASEPARTLLMELQFNLVREMAALSAVTAGGDDPPSGTYAAARAAEEEVLAELAPLADRIGGDVLRRFVETRALVTRWRERVATPDAVDRLRAGGALLELPRERGLFEQVLTSTAVLDAEILRSTEGTRARIVEAEQSGLRLTVLLGLLALLAAAAATALEARGRRYAAAAERRKETAEAALAESARANEARGRLLRGITHDVKNPLGAAKGYAEILAMGIKGPISPEQRPLIEGMQRSIDNGLAIITDLLDVARADSGALPVHRKEVDLAAITREAAADHMPAAEAAGHRIEVEGTDALLPVPTDPDRCRHVLDNLLTNAIKYTPPPGHIVVRAGWEEEAPSGGEPPGQGAWLAVRVIDNGPGIPAELREAIFDEFTRIEEGGKMKGHGLGLAISRRVARLLGGDLVVEDTHGRGACFVFRIPVQPPAAEGS